MIGILVMLTSWELRPGVIFDTRSVLLSLTGLFFGPLSSVIAVLITALFRLYLGGPGALTGVIAILVTTCIGVAWRLWHKPSLASISWRELYWFGIAVHLATLAAMLTLPWPLSFSVLQTISLPVFLIYPLATLFLGLLLKLRRRCKLAVEALEQSEFRYRSYVDNAPHGVFVLDGQGDVKKSTRLHAALQAAPEGSCCNCPSSICWRHSRWTRGSVILSRRAVRGMRVR